MSQGEPAFGNMHEDDEEDALTTEEELCLRQDTMREFFLQQLKALRKSVVSFQTKMQEDLKDSRKATETNLKEELNHYTERLETQIQTDLQVLEEHFNTAGHRVEEMVKAMGESVTKRMNDIDRKLDGLTSNITTMEVEVCSIVASTSFVESTPLPVLTTCSAVDQPSEDSEALSSTQVPDELGVTDISVDLLSLPGSSGLQKRPISYKRKLAQSLEDLEPELAAKLRPYTRLRFTKQEKLTGLQAAYFDLQMDQLKITDIKGLSDKADVIKEAGERDGLWSKLQAYLGERIKTNSKRRSEVVVQQEKDKLQQTFDN